MKIKTNCYLGNGVYISLLYFKSKKVYKVLLEFNDELGNIGRRIEDYCYTYIDAYYHYKELERKYFSIF